MDINMDFEEKVSIVVPVYNVEAYLERCIYSIISQTYNNIEIILVDDGSTDKSYAVCQNMAKNDKRILVYKQKHEGSAEARKAGIDCTSGNFVMTVDSDDWIDANMVEELMHYMIKYDVDMVLSGICYDYTQKEMNRVLLDGVTPGFYDMKNIETEVFDHFFLEKVGEYTGRGIRGHICTRLFKRNLLVNVMSQIDTRIKNGDDDVCLYSAILSSESIYILDKAFYHYCIRDNSLCQSVSNRSLVDVELLGKCLRNQVERHYAGSKLIKQLNRYMYLEAKECAKKIYQIKEIRRYIFPFDYLPFNSKIVIYGAGKVGKEYIKYLRSNKQYQLVAWIDKRVDKEENIQDLSIIKDIEYDYVLIAAASRQMAESMRTCISNFVENTQTILWEKPLIMYDDVSCENIGS